MISIIHPGIKIDEVIFQNSLGQSVKRIELGSDKKIDVSKLPKGIYFLQFMNESIPIAINRLVVD